MMKIKLGKSFIREFKILHDIVSQLRENTKEEIIFHEFISLLLAL